MNVTSIVDFSTTHLQVINEGTTMLIKKAYVEVRINTDDPDIIDFRWHWYEINDHKRLFYVDWRIVTTPAAGSAAALLALIQGYLISQFSGGGGTIYIDQKPLGTGSTFGAITGAIDGANSVFTNSQGVYTAGKMQVYMNGQLLTQGAYGDYYESDATTGEITFNFIPPSSADGTVITFIYQIP